jgi:hypothetical protein
VLTAYETAVLALIQAPSSPVPLITNPALDVYINIARGQVAGQGKCIRIYATLTLTANVGSYPFSAIPFAAPAGVVGPNAARMIWYQVGMGAGGTGQKLIANQPFEYFAQYRLNNPVPGTGPPTEWAQLGQGQFGTLFFDPVPDIPYVCPIDVECAPAPLVNDASPEAIPPLWQDAVPFYAAWLALQQLQRQADAEMMMKRFQELMSRARQAATPDVLPDNFEGTPDLTLGNKLGATKGGA